MSMKKRLVHAFLAAFMLLMSLAAAQAAGQRDGSWIVPFVPATLGLVRARATCIENGVTSTVESDLFSVLANGIVLPDVVLFRDTPIVAPLSLTAPAQTVTVATTPWLTAPESSPELTAMSLFAATSPSSPLHGPAVTKKSRTVEQLFQRGKELVEDNCDECNATTVDARKELLEAIDLWAIQHARIALAEAPPAVALHYAISIGQTLRSNHYANEAAALRREFAVKLKPAEDHYQDQ